MKMNNNDQRNQEKVIESLRECFIELLQEEWTVLLLITRKGYWAYKTLMDDAAWEELKRRNRTAWEKIKSGEKKILPDRYLMKMKNPDEFKNERVFVYDDTMTRGANLFFYYSYLTSKRHNINTTPVVYALSTEYPSKQAHDMLVNEYQRVARNNEEQDWKETAEAVINKFNNTLRWYRRLTSENLAEVCVCETKLFNKNLCPLVIDLPILSCMRIGDNYTKPAYMNNGTGEGILLTKEQFRRLTDQNLQWRFVSNHFPDNYIDYPSSYFEMRDIAVGNLKNVVLNMIVKCKYKLVDDKIKAVFVPFAVYRSMNFSDTATVFYILWGETEFGEDILNFIKGKIREKYKQEIELSKSNIGTNKWVIEVMRENHNLCRNMFRAIIFYLSAYIGSEFKDYVKETIHIELDYDWEFMRGSFSSMFCSTFKKMCDSGKAWNSYFMQTPCVESIRPTSPSAMYNAPKKIATKELIEKCIRKKVIDKKNDINYESINTSEGMERNLLERVYVIENIENDIEKEFIFENDNTKISYLTMVITDMLENSRLGNAIFIDNQKEVIYRGFRTGENSEILFYKGVEYFYAYVYSYYSIVGNKKYLEYYQKFIDRLELFLSSKKYLGTLISADDFKFYADYFGSLSDTRLDEQIRNKKYMLDGYWNPDDTSGIRQYVDEAYHNVQVWFG